MASLVLEPAGALSEAQLARVRVIYEDAFGSHLRVPFAELTRAGDVDRTFVALDGPAAVGFAALRRLGSVRWSFLRYFAGSRDLHGALRSAAGQSPCVAGASVNRCLSLRRRVVPDGIALPHAARSRALTVARRPRGQLALQLRRPRAEPPVTPSGRNPPGLPTEPRSAWWSTRPPRTLLRRTGRA